MQHPLRALTLALTLTLALALTLSRACVRACVRASVRASLRLRPPPRRAAPRTSWLPFPLTRRA